jgi:PleD family two-component response regulator
MDCEEEVSDRSIVRHRQRTTQKIDSLQYFNNSKTVDPSKRATDTKLNPPADGPRGPAVFINDTRSEMRAKSILIVDDEPFNIKALLVILNSIGFPTSLCETCFSGEEAVEKVRENLL